MNPRLAARSCAQWGAVVLLVLSPATGLFADADDDFGLAQNLFRDAGDYATSAQLFAEFIRNYPGDPRQADAALLLARSYARSQRCADAISAFEAFYDLHTEHIAAADARRERADCLQTLGSFGRAAGAYEDVQRLYSEAQYAAASLLSAAANYARAGDLANAVRVYEKLQQGYAAKPEARRGRYRLAQLRFASGDAGAAQALLASISEAAPRSDEARDALLLAGNIHLVLQRVAEAEADFRALHESFGGTAQSDSAYLDLAGYLLARGQHQQAIAKYASAVQEIRDSDLGARARLGHADALRLAGRAADALIEYVELAAVDSPIRSQARLGQAIALGQTDRFGAAVGLFLQLAQVPSGESPSPVAAAAVRELGALYRRQGDLARAGSWFRRYLEEADRFGDSFPESSAKQDFARLQLAQVLDANGYHDEAVRLFDDLARASGPLASESQYGLAVAHEGAGARRLAIGEYSVFLDRYPGHARATQVQRRIEYLSQYSIVDADRLAQALQQSYIDELTGASRQQVRFRTAKALHDHQDFPNAVRAWETYVGSYLGDPTIAEAQFYLADCLYRLSRQRQLEGNPHAADSLHTLALQEDRILGDAEAGRWSRLARLRQIESTAATQLDTARTRVLLTGYADFLTQHPLSDETAEARARALLGLGDARRQSAAADSAKLIEADEAYAQLLQEAAAWPQARRARFGRSLVALQRGDTGIAIDSLSALLPSLPGTGLQPEVLAMLGGALVQDGRHAEAATHLSELLLAFPDYPGRREAQELLGDTYLALGDATRAAELFAVLSTSDPDNDVTGSLRRRLATARQQQGNAAAALAIYDRLLVEGSGEADALQLARGRLLATLGRVQDAIDAFDQVRGSSLLPAARLGSANLHFASGRFERASAAYAPLLAGEISIEIMGRAVVSLYELGRRDEADKMAKQQLKRFGKDGVWPYLFRLYQGRYWLQQRQHDKARKIFESVTKDAADQPAHVDMGPGVPVAMRRMAADPVSAGAFLAVTSQWEQMRADPTEEGTTSALQAQANFARKYPDSPFAADIYLRLAEFYLALDNLLPAAGAFRRVADNPHATMAQKQDAIWQLLKCYTKLFQWDEALRVTQRIESEFPEHPRTTDVQLEIGYILKEMGQHAKAIEFLQKVLEWAEGEDAAEARFYIGEAYRNTGDYRKAIPAFYQVAFHGAGASTQWINTADFERARCYVELGEFDTARSVYERIIKREGGSSEWGRLAREEFDLLPSSLRGK
jgi:tetratricopeptide (TPR) repeat protein